MTQPLDQDEASPEAPGTLYSIRAAAALLRGFERKELALLLDGCEEVAEGIDSHRDFPCIEAFCRELHAAIDAGDLACYDDETHERVETPSYISASWRLVSMADVREWMAKAHPETTSKFLREKEDKVPDECPHGAATQTNSARGGGKPSRLSPEERRRRARSAADARHGRPGGSREMQQKMRDEWATGRYTSRDRCAEEMCGALEISLSAARKSLRNTPDPANWVARRGKG